MAEASERRGRAYFSPVCHARRPDSHTPAIFVAERVMQRIAEALATSLLSGGVRVPAISWGLAQPAGPTTADEMLEMADRAMYRHKGRSRKAAAGAD